MNTPIRPPGPGDITQAGSIIGGGSKAKNVEGESFSNTLKKVVEDVNSLQNEMDTKIEQFSTGEIEDIHEVMIAVEEASTAMEFMLEIRNKIVEAYQEVMRMPV